MEEFMIPLKVTRLRTRPLIFGILLVLVCFLAGTQANAQESNLFDAAKDGNLLRVKALLANGAEVNAKNNDGVTALMAATYSGQEGRCQCQE
jgi:ankyrin repeat protein